MGNADENMLLTSEELAHYVKVKRRTVETWRTRNKGPAYIRIEGGYVRYRLADVENWLNNSYRAGA
ncbi:helix-turn-helix transcriptional regulator [Nonomuraea candida]|uniref:helix-turn-helix transcriptional regulator n=1 Tax=Nonomuraea candida TaxID=359159 RepID=UPI0005BE70DE|nr:helix-turn-helix domain-containing protein [Nonomuraea candida]